MRSIRLASRLSDRIVAASRAEYPYEACGFLFADADAPDGPLRVVRSVEPAPNTTDGERRRRFVIAPDALRVAEGLAAARREVVCGFYHSHPDHPARPSAFDTEHAWPWYTYVIVGVAGGTETRIAAFELEGEPARFVPSALQVDTEDAPKNAGS